MLACIFVPLFPLAARLRSEPGLKGEAVAILEGNGNAARVLAATRKARQAGIEVGMTLPQARAILPKIVARGRDLESERAAQEALLEVAESFSPRVEDAGDGVAYLDLEGIPALTRANSSQLSALSSQPIPASPRLPAPPSSPLPPLPPGEGRGEGETQVKEKTSKSGRPQGPPLRTEERENPGSESSRFVGAGLVPARAPASSSTNPPSPRPPVPPSSSTLNSQLSTLNSSHSAEHALGRDIISAIEKVSLPARLGLAASKLAARVAASLPDSPTVVAPGDEASFLAPLPLSRLAPQLEIAETLERWGLTAIGDLAKLPEGEVASRLGELGRELHATARGIDPRPLEPRLPAPCFSEGLDLEWPLVTLEPFLFVGNAALERLMQRLESQALACTRLEVTLKLDPDGCDARAIQLPAPTRDAKTLLTLVRLELEARPPGAPIVGFTFAAHPDRPRRAQLALFGPPALSPDRLAATIARLASMIGAGRVGSPRTVDGHRPERFTLVDYTPLPPPSFSSPPPRTGRGLLAIRVLRPPVELEVIVEDRSSINVGAGLAPARANSHPEPLFPCHPERSEGSASANHKSQISNSSPEGSSAITNPESQIPPSPVVSVLPSPPRPLTPSPSQHSSRPPVPPSSSPNPPSPRPPVSPSSSFPASPRLPVPPSSSPRLLSIKTAADASVAINGAVKVSAGPWSMEEGWWSDTPADRDYWDVELSDGALYRIYCDRKTGAWFADGVYD